MTTPLPPYLTDVFGPGGILARAGLTVRAGQVTLADAINTSIRGASNLIIEGPTGIGKSFGYMIPASWHMTDGAEAIIAGRGDGPSYDDEGKPEEPEMPRTLIVTAGIALQEQLLGKDAPRLQGLLPWKFKAGLAKGVGNYLCLDKLDDAQGSTDPDFAAIKAWAETTTTGDFADLPVPPSPAMKAALTITSDDCTGKACPHYDACFSQKAKKKLRSAHVIVTNYHMFFAHLSLLKELGFGILPPFDVVVLDECFPAGTMIGATQIERVRVGDMVPSFCEASGEFVPALVAATMRSRPTSLVRVSLGGRSIVCTPGHPIMTDHGWVAASLLNVGDGVLSSNHAEDHGGNGVHDLRRSGARDGGRDVRSQNEGARVLLPGTLGGREPQSKRCEREEAGGSVRGGKPSAHDEQQPDGRSGDPPEVRSDAAADRAQAAGARRKGARIDGAADGDARCAGQRMASGILRRDGEGASERGQVVRDRRRASEEEDRGGDRRKIARHDQVERERREKGRVSSWARVERVEVLESGHDGTYGGACPDGFVYNIEVARTHTYIAEGFVVHNCHAAADVARTFFGFNLRAGQIDRAARLLGGVKATKTKPELPAIDADLCVELRAASADFFDALASAPDTMPRLRKPYAVDKLTVHNLMRLLKLAEQRYDVAAKALDALAESTSPEVRKGLTQRSGEIGKAKRRCGIYRKNVHRAMAQEDPNDVFYLETDPRGGVTLCNRLISVADVLREELFDSDRYRMVIATSATIQTSDGFGFAMRELGAQGTRALAVPSPFDFKSQALLVLPGKMPEPNAPTFRKNVSIVVRRCAEMADGRTLALFTSNAGVLEAAEHMRGFRHRVLVQDGSMQRHELMRIFRDDVHSVLLATRSFWAGVDIPGEALSCLVIDRLPFQTPEDPMLDAVRAQDPNCFNAYQLPRAAIELRQGVGRLIRSVNDRGVVVILDKRLLTKGYGKEIVRALPAMRVSTDLDDVGRFFAPAEAQPTA